MLNLNELDIDISAALEEHSKFICAFALKKLAEKIETSEECTCNELIKEFIGKHMDKALDKGVQKIIEAKPDELRRINKIFRKFVDSKASSHFKHITHDKYMGTKQEQRSSQGLIHDFFKRLESVFSYGNFGKPSYSKYKLTANLGVRTCIYCNRLYAVTHYKDDGGTLMNPQLDHWLPKSNYPLLQVSFYNLIPACDICNTRVKRIREFKENDHVHPYDEKYQEVKFAYLLNESIEGYKIVFDNDGKSVNKVRDTFEYIYVHEMYNAHILELRDLIKIKEAYGDTYLAKLQESFPTMNISKEDRYRLAFGVEMNPRKFHLYPLSKFKYDILRDLGIIE